MKFFSKESLIATMLVGIVSASIADAKPIEECLPVRKSFGSYGAKINQFDEGNS